MRERERELIAALAEGSLEDETEARRLLEASAEARSEYRLQMTALEALRQAEPVTMSTTERSDLHRYVWGQLRVEQAKTRSTAGIYRWSLAAAALFVVVGLAAVLGGGLLDQSQDEGAVREAAESLTTTGDLAADDSVAAPDALAGGEGETSPLVSPATRSYLEREAARLRGAGAGTDEAAPADREEDCLRMAGLPTNEIVAVLDDPAIPGGREYLATIPRGEPLGPGTPISFVDAGVCEVVHTAQ